MIVEFIGSTSAGKTTLIDRVRRSLAGKAEVATPFSLLTERTGLPHVTNISAQHILQELAGFPYFLWSLKRHRKFVDFVMRMLARQAGFSIFTINNLRSLIRKIGAYEMIRRSDSERIILVDEGTVLIAHNVFVYTDAEYTGEEIARFVGLVPLPDMIIYVKAPTDVLVHRSLQRRDPPREIRSKDPALVEKYIVRAAEMFDQLAKTEEFQSRLVAVEYVDLVEQGIDAVAERIADFIRNREIIGYRIHPVHQLAHNA